MNDGVHYRFSCLLADNSPDCVREVEGVDEFALRSKEMCMFFLCLFYVPTYIVPVYTTTTITCDSTPIERD